MIKTVNTSKARCIVFTVSVCLTLACFLAEPVCGSDGPNQENRAPITGDKSGTSKEAGVVDLAYALYRFDRTDSPPELSVENQSNPARTRAPRKLSFGAWLNGGNEIRDVPFISQASLAAPAVSTAPLSAREKFSLFLSKSFKPPGPYAFSAFSGALNELLDNDDGRVDDKGDFFADAGTRAARSIAFRASANFFNKFAYPVIFKQDPRYHRSGKTSVGGKIGYAVSRVFITQGDRSGDQFNISFIAGGLSAAALSNVWEREERQTVRHSLRRFGVHLGLTAFTNIVREFVGGQ